MKCAVARWFALESDRNRKLRRRPTGADAQLGFQLELACRTQTETTGGWGGGVVKQKPTAEGTLPTSAGR